MSAASTQKLKECEEEKTEWASLTIASIVSFFAAIQFTIYFSSLWPYLLQIDPEISETFFGWINAMYSLGQAIMCPTFGYISNRMGQSKIPIAMGVLLMMTGNCLYILCPLTPFKPRWILFFSRLVTGLGAGVVTVLRSYSAVASTNADRSRAISLNMGAFALGIAVGPAIQIVFTPLGYPGIHLFWKVHLDMYSGAAIVGILVNLFCLMLVLVLFRESTVGLHKKVKTDIESHARFFALPSYDKVAIAICIFSRFAQMFVITNLETIGPPLTMTFFNWSRKETVTFNSIMHIGFGSISLIIYGLDIGFNLSSKMSHRILTIVGLCGLALFHLLTYPWWFLSGKITYQQLEIEINGTMVPNPEPIGCRPSFAWCSEIPPVNVHLYLISYIFIIGTSFSLINLSMNTVYSKVIGPRNQGTLTGLLLLSGCVARICGPIFVSRVFETSGPRPAWIFEIVIASFCALLWVIFFKRMVPLRTADKYVVGDSFKNKHGHVYKF